MEAWASLFTVLVVAATVLLLLHYSSSRLKLPPGPQPLPVLGNLVLFLALKCKHRDLYKLAQDYGPLMWVRLGSHGTLVVQSPDMAMEVLKHQDSIFASRPRPGFTIKLLSNDSRDVVFAPYGSYWRFMRKVMTTQLLTQKRISQFQHVRAEEVGRMVETICSHVGQVVDLGHLLNTLNLNNITRIGMSKAAVSSYEVEHPQEQAQGANGGRLNSSIGRIGTDIVEDHQLVDLVGATVAMAGVQGIGDAIPWLSFLDNWFLPKAKFVQTKRQLDNYYARVIQEHRRDQAANPGLPPRDFVDVLLNISASEVEGEAVTDAMIASLLTNMLVGGTETSANTTEWAMAELLRQPALLEQAVQELEQVVGNTRAVVESDIPNLPYLHAVVKETMRLHPLVPLLAPHYSIEATTIAGYDIPAGTTVLVNAWALGQDPASWEEPQEFRPQRFLLPDGSLRSDVDLRGHHFQFLPFGSGKRICPGIGLGLAMVHLALATLLHSFTWSLPADVKRPQDLDMSEREGITVDKAVSLKVVPRLRVPTAART